MVNLWIKLIALILLLPLWRSQKRLQKMLKYFFDFDSNNNASIVLNRSFHYFLVTAWLQNIHTPSGRLKKINNLSYLAVNVLMEFLNYMFYTTHKKRQSLEVFHRKRVLKKSLMTVQYEKSVTQKKTGWKQCNTEKEQHEKSVAWNECNRKKLQHEKSAAQKKRKMKRMKQEESSHEKRETLLQHKKEWKKVKHEENMKSERNSDTLKKCDMKKVQNEKCAARRKHENWKK